jgi:predicted RNase H-like HicB family nuclease
MEASRAVYRLFDKPILGQLVEWPEVITAGKSLDDCRRLLQDALQEMSAAYRRQRKGRPTY